MSRAQDFTMTDDEKILLYGQHVFIPWSKQNVSPLMIKNADGVYLTLKDGKKLLDMKAQAFSANLGHRHKGMLEAMATAAARPLMGSEIFCEERLFLAKSLARICPQNADVKLTKAFFTLGGAEANENAIKIARMFTKKHKVITRYRSYHGATLAMINFSGDYRRIPVDNSMSGIIRFPDPYPRGSGQHIDTVRLLEEIIEIEGPETIACIMLEGITGSNGVFVPPPDYWPRIRALCDRHNIVLIADEVLSGFFRTGTWFGIDHFNVVPDIITMSKGLTAGYAPLGAVMVKQEIADYFNDETLWCGLTQYGHSWCCAVARAALYFYENDNIAMNVATRASELTEMLNAMTRDHKIVALCRSIGLLAAIDLKNPHDDEPLVPYRATGDALKPNQLLQTLLKEAGISTVVRFGTILISPPLIINQEELKKGMLGIDQALKGLSDKIKFK